MHVTTISCWKFVARTVACCCLFVMGLVIISMPMRAEEITSIELKIEERALVGETSTIKVTEGQTVELVWLSDEPGELHLHGYDIEIDLPANEPTVMRFEAHAAGRFPITSHGFGAVAGHSHRPLAYLEVHPN